VDPANARLLAKYLKQIVVKVIHLNEFHPTKTKVEKGDIESVVGEFRKFLETAVDGDGKGQSTILEIKEAAVMVKIKLDTGKTLFDSQDATPAMPDGFYTGDQPNPNLRKFVEKQGTAYDYDSDRYS